MFDIQKRVEGFNRLLDGLVERMRAQPTYGWATVVAVAPLQIRYDGATDPVAGSPASTVAGLQPGDRVFCIRIHRRDIILGRGKGDLTLPHQTVRENVDNITATAVAEFNVTALNPLQITLPTATWFRFVYQAWKGGTSGELRVGIRLSGATVQDHNAPTWGTVVREVGEGNIISEKITLLEAGTTNVHVMGYKIGAGTQTVSYQILTAHAL